MINKFLNKEPVVNSWLLGVVSLIFVLPPDT